jgi:hypothetical protein
MNKSLSLTRAALRLGNGILYFKNMCTKIKDIA